jgi:peptidoglycan/LPS O-acetylase OafA/YrhL
MLVAVTPGGRLLILGPMEASLTAVPQAVAPPPGNPRFPLFDGLRAIAALSVVVNHVGERPNGVTVGWVGDFASQMNAGVTIFFLISGFLLYRPFVAARHNGRHSPRIRDFARRRILRIVPGYWFALTITTLWLGLSGPFGDRWWLYYGFGQTYDPRTAFSGLSVAWSLSTEMTFYVLLPLYAIVVGALIRRCRRTLMCETVLLAGLALIALLFDLVEPHHASWKYTYTIAGTFDWFALGMFLAVMSVAVAARSTPPVIIRVVHRLPGLMWSIAVGSFVLTVLLYRYHPIAIGTHLLFGATAFFLLLPAVFVRPTGRHGVPALLLGTRLLTWLGLISYGIYLWHTPLILRIAPSLTANSTNVASFVTLLAVAVTASIAIGAASYYLVEQWFLRLKDPARRRRTNFTHESAAPDQAR